MDLRVNVSATGIGEESLGEARAAARAAIARLAAGDMELTGWVDLPARRDNDEIEAIIAAAEDIRSKADLLIVIGVGGSYLGARAVTEALRHCAAGGLEIRFAGNCLSGTYHKRIIEEARGREFCLCVISKSGTTVETTAAFALLKAELFEKYGAEEAMKRIYAVTSASGGALREEAEREGYASFAIPDDIGGRYSVLTPAGLLPVAAAGIDIYGLLDGALAAATAPWQAELADYAVCRHLLMESGKQIEIFEYYEPQLNSFAEWLKQLFGESEGKQGRGLFPASLSLSADLHSMGQFLQEGKQIFFETVLDVQAPPDDVLLPKSAGSLLAGRSLNSVNRAALKGVFAAHRSIGIPIVKIDIPQLTPRGMGEMIYFFEMSCAVTGLLMGLNPFDQPGVEHYKAEMKKELAK